MRRVDQPPFAPALIESMRAVGYTLEAAVADIIDNSVSAEAKTIGLRYSPYQDPYVAIIDDGKGMTESELIEAMRHGSQNPNQVRQEHDLGRFGLGLKTASLSQARQLTVISSKNGRLAAARWDLDIITKTQMWTLLVLDAEEIAQLPLVRELEKQESGTIVLWRSLDRLAAGEGSVEHAMGDGMTRVRAHLALVFHRFLKHQGGQGRIVLKMNNAPVKPVDPFLQNHAATQALPRQIVRLGDAVVDVHPYILPHYSKLTREELRIVGGEEGLRRQQGFYVYRNNRLIVWGTWFRLARQDELTKLARVQVDIPNSLDHLWTLDIKKSAASPPLEVRKSLATIINRIGDTSGRVYRYRGRAANTDSLQHLWDRVEERSRVSYAINREHPVYTALSNLLDDSDGLALSRLASSLEAALPIAGIYVDMASDRAAVQTDRLASEELSDLAASLLDTCGTNTTRRRNLLRMLHLLEPFSMYPEETAAIVKRHDNGD